MFLLFNKAAILNTHTLCIRMNQWEVKYKLSGAASVFGILIIIIIIIIYSSLLFSRVFPGTFPLEPVVHPTTQASSF
jgi:hypothetical protein